jgi:hypothetical protein
MKTARNKMLAPVFVRAGSVQYFGKDWRKFLSTNPEGARKNQN